MHATGQVASYDGPRAACGGAERAAAARRRGAAPARRRATASTPAATPARRSYRYRVLARAGSARRSRRDGRCGGPTGSTATLLARVRGAAPGHARLHGLHADRDRTTRASTATSSRPAGSRTATTLAFEIEADTFMRHMNRVLVGTMLQVAGGRRPLEDFAALLDGRAPPRRRADRAAARPVPHRRALRLSVAVRRGAARTTLLVGWTARMNVLLTNDDGIDAEGLLALRRALRGRRRASRCVVIAPDGNRSAMARMITTRQPLWVAGGDVRGRRRSATRPTARPSTACASAQLGLVEDFEPELIVSGINHGSNLGDDITYSGTVAAAFEGIVLGIPAIAVSQQSTDARDGLPLRRAASTSTSPPTFTARHRRRARRRAAAARARCSTSTSPATTRTASR